MNYASKGKGKNEEVAWNCYEPNPGPPMRATAEKGLHKHLTHTKDDDQKLIELEKWRTSMRHLAHVMGVKPEEFNYEQQIEAIRYLMPGYALFAEANPQMEHPLGTWF